MEQTSKPEVGDNSKREYIMLRAKTLGLTERQATIAALLADGLKNREIGDALCVTEKTIKFHLGNIYKKSACKTRLALALTLLDGYLGSHPCV